MLFDTDAIEALAQVDEGLSVESLMLLPSVIVFYQQMPRLKGEPEEDVPPQTVGALRRRVKRFRGALAVLEATGV